MSLSKELHRAVEFRNGKWRVHNVTQPKVPEDVGILASDAERDAVVEQLRTACEEGRLSTEALEWRVQRVLEATHRPTLDRLIQDLPEPRTSHISNSMESRFAIDSPSGVWTNAVVILLVFLLALAFLMDPGGMVSSALMAFRSLGI